MSAYAWRETSAATLKALKSGCHPKELIVTLAEGLLAHYHDKPLIDAYDIYQHLMDYWAETMQDDCYLIAADGWKAETSRIIETKKSKDGKVMKKIDKGWTCDLVPKALLVARYYSREQGMIDQLKANLESLSARIAELEEEHGGEDGFLGQLEPLTKPSVLARSREIRGIKDMNEEAGLLGEWLVLTREVSELKTAIKDNEEILDSDCYRKYPTLTAAEVKTLVVNDKWLATLDAAIHAEMDRVSQQLTQRVKELAERYETPLPQMVSHVAELEARVNRHLEKMGFTWA